MVVLPGPARLGGVTSLMSPWGWGVRPQGALTWQKAIRGSSESIGIWTAELFSWSSLWRPSEVYSGRPGRGKGGKEAAPLI